MTLHEAILAVVKKKEEPMKAKDIAQEINKFSLYKPKGDKPVSANQVWARSNKYKDIFRITDDKRIDQNAQEYLEQEGLLKWVRNFLVHNYSTNSDVLIPFLIFATKYSRRLERFRFSSDNIDSQYFTKRIKRYMLDIINDVFDSNISPSILHTLNSSIEQLNENATNTILAGLDRFYYYLSNLNENGFEELFNKIILQFSGARSRNFEFGTPEVISNFIEQLVDIKTKQIVFDPFAGFCILLTRVLSGKKNVRVIANDINENTGTVGILNLMANRITDFEYTFNDAYSMQIEKSFDWVVTNPPFIKYPNLNNQRLRGDNSLENSILIAYRSLKRNGKAVIIVPDSFLYSGDRIYFQTRQELIQDNAIKAIISLPTDSFQPFAGIATSVLYLDKENQKSSIFFADFSSVPKNEFEYKIDEFANIVRKEKEIINVATFIAIEKVLNDEYLNLLPRKNVLYKFSDTAYLEEGIALKELIERRITGYPVLSTNLNDEKDGTPYIRIVDLVESTKLPYIAKTPSKYISDIEQIKSASFVEEGAVAIAKIGGKLKPSIYKLNEPAIIGNNILCFIVKKDRILPEYLVQQLQSNYVQQQLEAIIIRGVGPNYFKERDLLNLRILVPPIHEQHTNVSLKMNSFWSAFKSSVVDLFQVDDDKTSTSKPIREEEIISSIQHRISQYISPISSDLQNLELYISNKINDGTPFLQKDKISSRSNAILVTDVFKRMGNNLKGIGQTFDLMKNILYFKKDNSNLIKSDISKIINEAYDSIKYRMNGVIFNFTIDEESIKQEDLKVPIDRIQLIELFRNFFINSYKHGFDETIPKKIIYVFVSKNASNNYLEINLINNGKPFPEGFTLENFTSFGTKGVNSDGTGIGGYLMKKIIDNHEGKLEWLGNENIGFTIESNNETIHSIATIHFKISLPYINI